MHTRSNGRELMQFSTGAHNTPQNKIWAKFSAIRRLWPVLKLYQWPCPWADDDKMEGTSLMYSWFLSHLGKCQCLSTTRLLKNIQNWLRLTISSDLGCIKESHDISQFWTDPVITSGVCVSDVSDVSNVSGVSNVSDGSNVSGVSNVSDGLSGVTMASHLTWE